MSLISVSSLYETFVWLTDVTQGLTRDEQELHSDRIKLWNEFNLCWLAVLQRQKDNTQKMIETGQNVRPPESVLEEEYLERMGREIVRFCDSLERHGLVDYQMGVWEEEIISSKAKLAVMTPFLALANEFQHSRTALTYLRVTAMSLRKLDRPVKGLHCPIFDETLYQT